MKRFLLSVITLLCICACTKGPEGESGNDPNAGGVNDNQSQSKGPITLTLESITATTVTFSARLDVDMMADYQEVGFVLSTEEDLDIENSKVKKVKINKENYVEVFEGLTYDTEYYYAIYLLRNNIYSYSNPNVFKTNDVFIDIDDVAVTNTTVTFMGNVVRKQCDSKVKVGLMVSQNENFSGNLTSSYEIVPEEDGSYSKAIEQLELDTTYYFRTYVCQNGVYEYGKVDVFVTVPIEIELLAENISNTTASITGRINPMSSIDEVKVGILIGNMETLNKNRYTYCQPLTSSDFDEEGRFVINFALLPDEEYYYRYYVLHNEVYSYGEIKSFKTEDLKVVVNVSDITQTTVSFSGNIELAEHYMPEVGILYSTSSAPEVTTSGVGKVVLTDLIDANGNFAHKSEGLLSGSTHYCRYYIRQDDTLTYGDVFTFKTEKVPVVIEVESINKNVVIFKGNVQFTEPGVIKIGVKCFPMSSYSASQQEKVITEFSENGDFIVEFSQLQYATDYYWKYYLLQNNGCNYGEVKNFRTLPHPYDVQAKLNISSATDLSSYASANCYIVSNVGLYKFKAVIGNSSESVGAIASASILWETFGTSETPEYFDLIKGCCYSDGYIVFETAETFKEGNAVIAAKDGEGNILWSWHIWMTDQPTCNEYYNNAGVMMDRNLGATSATPGDVGALGLLYQWGRKDPFLGASSIRSNSLATSTITWPSAVFSDPTRGTIAWATAHPTTFITSRSYNWDWYYTGSSSYTDRSRWRSEKTIYDPCPAGWRAPSLANRSIWVAAINSGSPFECYYDNINEGINFSAKFGSAASIWYPASGYRDVDGCLEGVGNTGTYWDSHSPGGDITEAYTLDFTNYGEVDPWGYDRRVRALSIRCLQE